jgi:hypothetical protein
LAIIQYSIPYTEVEGVDKILDVVFFGLLPGSAAFKSAERNRYQPAE